MSSIIEDLHRERMWFPFFVAFSVAFVFCPDQGADGLEGSFDLQAWGLLAYFSMQF